MLLLIFNILSLLWHLAFVRNNFQMTETGRLYLEYSDTKPTTIVRTDSDEVSDEK